MNQIKMDNTEVNVEIVNEKTIVNVDTLDGDVYVNGVCIWSKYDKPEYNHIPPVLRNFVYERNGYLKDEGDTITADLWKKDSLTCATFYIPKNTNQLITARMDFITSMDDLEFDFIRNRSIIDNKTADNLINEFKGLFKDIEDTVKSVGYRLAFSHESGDAPFGWWDIFFALNKWNEETFIKIWDKFSHFNNRLNEVLDKI